MALKTECISRPNLGTSADVPDVPSHTSMIATYIALGRDKGPTQKMPKRIRGHRLGFFFFFFLQKPSH